MAKKHKQFYILGSVVIIAVTALTCAHSISVNALQGKYNYRNELSSAYLTLNADTTFEFESFFGLGRWRCQGKWTLDDDLLLLSSNKKRGIIEVYESKRLSDSVVIVVNNNPNEPTFIGQVYVNGDESQKVWIPDNRIVCITDSNHSIRSISLVDIPITYKYTVKDTSSNYFEFTAFNNDVTYMYFDNEQMKVQGDSIIGRAQAVFTRDTSLIIRNPTGR
jgi:hypothetical protein